MSGFLRLQEGVARFAAPAAARTVIGACFQELFQECRG